MPFNSQSEIRSTAINPCGQQIHIEDNENYITAGAAPPRTTTTAAASPYNGTERSEKVENLFASEVIKTFVSVVSMLDAIVALLECIGIGITYHITVWKRFGAALRQSIAATTTSDVSIDTVKRIIKFLFSLFVSTRTRTSTSTNVAPPTLPSSPVRAQWHKRRVECGMPATTIITMGTEEKKVNSMLNEGRKAKNKTSTRRWRSEKKNQIKKNVIKNGNGDRGAYEHGMEAGRRVEKKSSKKGRKKKRIKRTQWTTKKCPAKPMSFFPLSFAERIRTKYFYCFRSRTTTNSMMTKWE